MIRELTTSDVERVADLAIDAEMFPEDAREFLTGSARAWLDSDRTGASWIVMDDDGVVVGAAFFEPRDATDRVWYLQMIVVAPDLQGTGRGTRLLRHVEETLAAQDQRLLLIETSGTSQYDGTRRFYAGVGYDEVARVPDYFEDGDDMVLFRKDLRRNR